MAPGEPEIPRAVLERAARGDVAAFGQIVARFERPVYSLVHRLTGDAECARDVTQEVFLKAWKNLSRYDPDRPFAPWFLKLAANLALNARAAARLRKTSRSTPHAGTSERRGARGTPGAPVDAELRAAVRTTVADLEPKYACRSCSFTSRASRSRDRDRLDLPHGTVKIRLHRARDVLKETLERFKT